MKKIVEKRENNIRPNYYRINVKVRDKSSLNSSRATIQVELEAQDLIEALGLGFNTGNAMKYMFRCGRKNEESKEKDLKKIATYIDFALDELRNKG